MKEEPESEDEQSLMSSALKESVLDDYDVHLHYTFYVTDGNIMYLTDASRFLISGVIQHYAPVVGWGGGGTDA